SGRFSEGLLYVNGRGYIDRQENTVNRLGRDIAGHVFTRCEEFHEERAAVECAQKWGFLDRAGALVVAPIYPSVQPFFEGLAAVTVRRGTVAHVGYIDRAGKVVIEPRFHAAGAFKEGLAPVRVSIENEPDDVPRLAQPERSRWGFVDRRGKMVIPPRFYAAQPFANGLARVSKNPYHDAFVDSKGQIVWELARPAPGAGAKAKSPVAAGSRSAKIALVLTAERTTIRLGEEPRFRAELTNEGA